ncbi:hypothetical protein BLS_009137 [Venturia inaequalis]|uniref:Uncharacterized protein n=2 Tax=Venturia inaequalis TaxID=5025 RepID=A0A8H3YKB0_VENIN|nr:hypothetical protein BLS_009137 [Venturia inaequalis]
MSFTAIMSGSPALSLSASPALSTLSTTHRRNFSLNAIASRMAPAPKSSTYTGAFAKPLFDIESYAFITIFRALQHKDTITHEEMTTIKSDIRAKIRSLSTNKTKPSTLTGRKKWKWNEEEPTTTLMPLALPTEREMTKKIARPIDTTPKTPLAWILRPELADLALTTTATDTDTELLLQIRRVVAGGAPRRCASSLSRSSAVRMAEFMAHAQPESFELRRADVKTLVGFTESLDASRDREGFGFGEMRRCLEVVGQEEVKRLLRGAEGDPGALVLLGMRLRDVRGF